MAGQRTGGDPPLDRDLPDSNRIDPGKPAGVPRDHFFNRLVVISDI